MSLKTLVRFGFGRPLGLYRQITRKRVCGFSSHQTINLCRNEILTKSPRPKILICRNDVPSSILKILQDYDLNIWERDGVIPRSELLRRVEGVEALWICVGEEVDEELLEAAGPNLKVISTSSSGCDHIDIPAVRKRGIRLGYNPGVQSDAVAEFTVAITLACMRGVCEARAAAMEGQWSGPARFFWMTGLGLKGAVVGIIGLGSIGLEVAKRLIPFKVKEIIYTSRSGEKKQQAEEVNARLVDLKYLLKNSDVVIVANKLSAGTQHMLSDPQFAMMKKSAIVVNTARGDIIDQEALVRALQTKRIWGAALDVTTPEPLPQNHVLFSLPHCYVFPHLASNVTSARAEMLELSALNIVAALENREMPAEVL